MSSKDPATAVESGDGVLPIHYVTVSNPVGDHRWLVTLNATSVCLYSVKGAQEPVLDAFVECTVQPILQGDEKHKEVKEESAAAKKPATMFAFPRIASFSPDAKYLAIGGDEKTLRIWELQSGKEGGNLQREDTLLVKNLPKRAAVLVWEESATYQGERNLIIGDRHGDVRLVTLSKEAIQATAEEEAEEGPARKKQRIENGEEEEEDYDPAFTSDPSMRPLLGHVSMLCDVVLAPEAGALEIPSRSAPYIITSDRDEHIRVSRWGKRRQAYIIERFLLGSDSFIGCMKLVPHPDPTESRRWAILASDGGRKLRLWDYLEEKTAEQCIAQLDVGTLLAPQIREDTLQLKRKWPAKDQETPADEAEIDDSKLAIIQMELLSDGREGSAGTYVLFRAESGQAIFVLPLESVMAGTLEELQSLTFGRPVLHVHVESREENKQRILVALDGRQSSQALANAKVESDGAHDLVAAVFKDGKLSLDPQTQAAIAALQPDGPKRSKSNAKTLKSLQLYWALQAYPKSSAEGSQMIRNAGADGRKRPKGRRARGRERNLKELFGDQVPA